jgi:hypothetical protein
MDVGDRRLIDHLRGRWDVLFRLTTLAQGAEAIGQDLSNERRLRVGEWLLSHPDVHPNVQRWGARTFVLTEQEKLAARLGQAGGSPVLKRLGLVEDGRLAPDAARLVGPLGFTFHTALIGSERFNVP